MNGVGALGFAYLECRTVVFPKTVIVHDMNSLINEQATKDIERATLEQTLSEPSANLATIEQMILSF